jgi:hypothetical protein
MKFELQTEQVPVFAKDLSLGFFIRKFPEFVPLVNKMRSLLPDGYTNYLVDLVVTNCRPGVKTCKDTRWHVDGDFLGNNVYVLWAKGPNRTQFPRVVPDLDMPENRNDQSIYLENLGLDGVEVDDQTIVRYSSQTPHRGVVCKESGFRTFVRMMATNTISPKNIIKEKI